MQALTDTKWNIGYFGGVTIVDSTRNVSNIIPKGMNEILKTIQQAQNENWDKVLNTVERIITMSAKRQDHSFFNKRGKTTQLFYDEAQKLLKKLHESNKAVPIAR